MKKYDLIVMGGGAGGLTVAAGAASLGGKVALIEKNDQLGGDCLHYGCVPSKTLIEAANRVHEARSLKNLGLQTSGAVDMKAVMGLVRESISHIQKHDDADRFRKLGVDVYFGQGSFHSPHEVRVKDEMIYGKKIVVATGSRPSVPEVEGLEECGFLTNESIFGLRELPQRLAVIGGGPVGLELAQAMSRLGSETTVIDRSPALFGKEDKEVSQSISQILEKELTILTEASVEKVEMRGGKKTLFVNREGVLSEFPVDEILVAAGRVPNTGSLGLEKAGVQTDERGYIIVNNRLESNVPHIYAIGDVNGAFPFTHVAGMEGKLVVQNALLGLRRKVSYDNVPWVIYTSPEVFHLGMTEEEARDQAKVIRVFRVPLSNVDRFVTDHRTDGFVKVITDKKGIILGAHAVGGHAGDFMQEITAAKQFNKKIGALSNVVHPYPSHSAAVGQTADLYWRETLFEGRVQKMLEKYVKWKS
ncbi:pyruvate/2-oxoglutarate dehydrogenase complex dihydrolipoamide dehydrogenase (E3) component [Bacillus tianshenii]|uniref:Pyruvate/2-oxoglutarate dehydrogenase complex dihydrolipoamide dehydrogenase (E3) component n=1 Tax=Sutcliffiella tianshenii TaxID=1463404 RepID=A0ABS2NYF1_9BACI|nr:mercuric reductase [Bacillus tianshenii]MBM7619698.1 pyruvate/2-oxoglutarate dehydrogenase complex dihydrolipoamide dehydrogenase (E3) component [Bacillus tianshenii]